MSRTRIKICGITRAGDAVAAIAAGADAVGLVFYAASSRAVSLQQAREVASVVPPFVTLVALFVDAPRDQVEEVCAEINPGLLQFHGSESPEYCRQFQRPWIKALRVGPDSDVDAQANQWGDARGILLDTYRKGQPGGTGEAFDWDLVPAQRSWSLVLAGGLLPGNVGEAIRQTRPFAVDVSGGVESAPGIKDVAMMQEFVSAVRSADME